MVVTDTNVAARTYRWVKLVDEVRDQGGEVRVLSSMHESGKRLEALGGIAAILTYPIENLDEGIDDGGDLEDGVEDVHDGDNVNGLEGRRDMDEDIDF